MSEETPLDKFKRALTGGARAIAREPEVEVAWSADRPGAAGKNFRVPLPGRQLPREQAAEARGFAENRGVRCWSEVLGVRWPRLVRAPGRSAALAMDLRRGERVFRRGRSH